MKNSQKACPQFLITFLLFVILAYITFLFPLKSVLNMKNSSWHKPHIFWGIFAGTVFLSGYFLKCTWLFKGIMPKIFWYRARTLYAYRESSQRLILFHWYWNFNPPTRFNDCDICGMYDILAKMSSFNLFFVFEKFGHTGIPGLWMQVLDAGLWTLGPGCYILDAGLWILDTVVDCCRTESELSFWFCLIKLKILWLRISKDLMVTLVLYRL